MGSAGRVDRNEYQKRWTALHGDVVPSRIVSGWLTFAYRVARPLAVFSANSLSMITVLIGAIAAWFSPSPWMALVVIGSLILDGIDGTVAILRNEVTLRGAVLDSAADRLVEVAWLIAMWRCGVPIWILIGIWVIGLVQEYLRAKLTSLGVREVGVVTIAERPVRGLLIAAAIGISFLSTPLGLLLLGMELYALRQVTEYAHDQLHKTLS